MRTPHVVAVVDLQFGSTGKGSMAAYLSMCGYNGVNFTAAATNWGPNAGHTSVYPDGEKIIRTMLANSVHRGTVERVYIGPGSAINIGALAQEIEDTRERTRKQFIVLVHEHAAVVLPEHREAETIHNRIGSTQKGTAQAWIDKMMRDNNKRCLARDWRDVINQETDGIARVVSHEEYVRGLWGEDAVLAEGCQGYSLGYSSGFWPYVTGRECTTAQLLADTLLPPCGGSELHVIGCARTYPIRVANRFDADGNMVGFSGPCYADQSEISFEDIGQPVEYTTVTKLPRRIFTFSFEQLWQAERANGVESIFMNFMNYLPEDKRDDFLRRVKKAAWPAQVKYLGFGPSTSDIELLDI